MTHPVIDWSLRNTKNKNDRIKLHENVIEACKDYGAFYLKNSITNELLQSVECVSHEYFALSLEDKMKNDISQSSCHRGYFPVGYENAKYSKQMDFKEGFDLALELSPSDPDVLAKVPLHGPNVWPEKPINFCEVVKQFYDNLKKIAEELCVIISNAIDLPADYFSKITTKPLAQLRLLHYPYSTVQQIGAGAHTDYGIITLLWQDNIGGLEVKTSDGKWSSVVPIPGAIFCFIGDAVQRVTNDTLKATVHRVINKKRCNRYSAAFFFFQIMMQ